MAAVLTAALAPAAASAATMVLDPGPGTDYLSIWCGGQKVNEIAAGFDAAGNGRTLVTVETTCNGSGRGSPSSHYLACWTVTFGEDGGILAKTYQVTNHWVQGSPAIPCPFPADPAAVYTFTDGLGQFPASLRTTLVGTTTERALIDSACSPIHYGDTVAGTIDAPGGTACYSFAGTAGDGARIAVAGTSGALAAAAQVHQPDGTVLCGAAGGEAACALDATGRHVIAVGDASGTGTGGFDLTLTCTTPGCEPFDYALADQGAMTVAIGSGGSTTITATLSSGIAQSVTFTASGLPAGASASFDPAACAPPCAALMTIATAEDTPPGTDPITVVGDPLGRSTTFNLTVAESLPGGCPATIALFNAPDRTSVLGVLHQFRDVVLSRSPEGRRLTRLFYAHAAEAAWMMLRDPELRARSLALIERFRPALEGAVAGKTVTLTADDAATIDSLLAAFMPGASPALRDDLAGVRRDLKRRAVLQPIGVSIR